MVYSSLKFSLRQLKLFLRIKIIGGKSFFFMPGTKCILKTHKVGFLDASFGSDGGLSSLTLLVSLASLAEPAESSW